MVVLGKDLDRRRVVATVGLGGTISSVSAFSRSSGCSGTVSTNGVSAFESFKIADTAPTSWFPDIIDPFPVEAPSCS